MTTTEQLRSDAADATPAAETASGATTPPVPPHTIYVTAPPAPKRGSGGTVVAALLVGALAGGGIGAAAGAGTAALLVRDVVAEAAPVDGPGLITVNDPDEITPVTAIAAKASPSVVTIAASGSQAAGSGSGIILDSSGLILTNTHVVTLDGMTRSAQIEVITNDGRIFPAEVVGLDPISDLAVIKITGATGLVPIEWASSSELNVGDRTVVIGAPLGLSNSVSDGIVSALNRGIRIASSAVPEDSSDGEGDAPEFGFEIPGLPQSPSTGSGMISIPVIQTDAAVNPGNSGGALVDSEGRLIGVIVAIASTGSTTGGTAGSIGVGFAIPSDLAQRISEELIANGTATHGLLGLTSSDAGAENGTLGAVVQEVFEDSPAAQAGIRTGDVITSVGGIPISSATDLTAQIRALAAGSETEVGYIRAGAAATATVTLGTLE